MQPNDFVFKQIYSGALKIGAKESAAHRHAVMGLDEYKKGKLSGKRVSSLIENRVKLAKRDKY